MPRTRKVKSVKKSTKPRKVKSVKKSTKPRKVKSVKKSKIKVVKNDKNNVYDLKFAIIYFNGYTMKDHEDLDDVKDVSKLPEKVKSHFISYIDDLIEKSWSKDKKPIILSRTYEKSYIVFKLKTEDKDFNDLFDLFDQTFRKAHLQEGDNIYGFYGVSLYQNGKLIDQG